MINGKKNRKELLVIPMLLVLTLLVVAATRNASRTQTIVINEVCSSNYSILQNSSGDYSDYVELYNASDFDISLLNWTLNTESSLMESYTFGDVVLAPHSYLLLVYNASANASGSTQLSTAVGLNTTVPCLEMPCAISSAGEIVYLRNSSKKTVDAVDIPALRQDTVYARGRDGNSEWDIYSPSPGVDNSIATLRMAPSEDMQPAFSADMLSLPVAEYSEFPIISITMSEDDISGTSGIFLAENRSLSGRAAERPCQIDYFSEGMHYMFSEDAGIRIAGRSNSLNYPDFNLYARSQDFFSYSFFDKGLFYQKLELNHMSASEYFLRTLLEEDGLCPVSTLPCVVFLNGEFYGEYYLTEPLDANLLADTYQLETDGITVLEDGLLEAGSQYALLQYQNLIKTCAENGFDKETFDYFCSVVDIDSLIDYYVVQLYLNNVKCTPYQNCFVWKSETVDETSPYQDGKWRYEITGLGDAMPSSLTYEQESDYWLILRFRERDPVFDSLIQNPTFRDMFSARMHALASGTFSETRIYALWSEVPCFPVESTEVYEEFLLFLDERYTSYLESFDEFIINISIY